MKKQIENILQELYGVDSELKNREEELIQIIDSMINLKPNVKIDENFKQELRQKIAKEISVKKMQNFQSERNKPSIFQILSYVFGTVGIAAFGFFMFKDTLFKDINLGNGNQNIKFESTVTESKQGFGKLSNVGNQNNAKGGEVAMDSKTVVPVSAPIRENKIQSNNIEADTTVIDAVTNGDISVSSNDGSTHTISSPNAVSGSEGSSMGNAGISTDLGNTQPTNSTMRTYADPMPKMIAPDDGNYIPEVYRYTFSGDLNIDLKDMMSVYKKDSKKVDNKVFFDSLSKLNFAGVEVSNFKNVGISNISLVENEEYGYNINIDFDNSSLNIYKNWAKWPQDTYTEGEKQVFLDEKEVIKIANDFLNTYKIDLSKYGTPIVEKSYVMAYAKYTSSKIMPEYTQNITNVVFPLIVDGNEIYEEGGQVSGVRIEIDLKAKKVTSLNSLSVDNYLKSDYKIEINNTNILKVASKGGRYGFYDVGKNVKYVDIKLKNPKLKYINTFNYKTYTQEQFLIPAIVFEIDNKNGAEYNYGETITVPLVKDFYKYDGNGAIIGASE
ncbi:MAG: hypothetical protein WC850_06180 [Candidatus Gracilibacteria bacterium]